MSDYIKILEGQKKSKQVKYPLTLNQFLRDINNTKYGAACNKYSKQTQQIDIGS